MCEPVLVVVDVDDCCNSDDELEAAIAAAEKIALRREANPDSPGFNAQYGYD